MLSGLLITRNSAPWLPYVLANMRAWADEVVVVVDVSATDTTYDAAFAGGADVVAQWPVYGYLENVLQQAVALCSGDWIMRVDDDELLPPRFRSAADYLMAQPGDDFVLRRLHLATPHTMYDMPMLWPDPQIRLRSQEAYRQSPWPTTVHGIPEQAGLRRWNVNTSDTTIWHLHYLLRTHQERLAMQAVWQVAGPEALVNQQAVQADQNVPRTMPVPLESRPAELDALLAAAGATI